MSYGTVVVLTVRVRDTVDAVLGAIVPVEVKSTVGVLASV